MVGEKYTGALLALVLQLHKLKADYNYSPSRIKLEEPALKKLITQMIDEGRMSTSGYMPEATYTLFLGFRTKTLSVTRKRA